MSGPPLAGLKVVEFARVLAGPWAAQILADLGARVIKIESPSGDDTRQWGPPFLTRADGSREAAYFHATNRGKESRTLDFKNHADRAEARRLALEADVVIENFKVGGLARFGLDYDSLRDQNPSLVYCSITGFGQDGPWAHLPGYDFIVQGLSGIMDLTGAPGEEPQKIGVAYADIMTGLYSVIAIQAALAERLNSGLGQKIDMSLLDVMVGTLANQAMNYLVSGSSPTRLGNRHPNIAPYEVFQTKDSWIVLAVGNDRQFERLCNVLGLEVEAKYRTNSQRLAQREDLAAWIGGATCERERDFLLRDLQAAGVPAGPINTVAEAFANEQVVHRQMKVSWKGEGGEEIPGVRLPIRFSRSPLAPFRPSPRHCQRNRG